MFHARVEASCPGCGRADVKYHAKNKCTGCYLREWRTKRREAAKAKEQAENKV